MTEQSKARKQAWINAEQIAGLYRQNKFILLTNAVVPALVVALFWHWLGLPALLWLGATYEGPLSVATGFVGLGGLDALARLVEEKPRPVRWVHCLRRLLRHSDRVAHRVSREDNRPHAGSSAGLSPRMNSISALA